MDAPETETWKDLRMHVCICTYVLDREYWSVCVRSLRQSRVTTVTLDPHRENEMRQSLSQSQHKRPFAGFTYDKKTKSEFAG